MHRDFYLLDRNSSRDSQPSSKSASAAYDDIGRRRVSVHVDPERAIRERYLEDRRQPDFAPPLPPPPPNHFGIRWNRTTIDAPSSLMSPESPENLRHPPSPHLLKKSEHKPDQQQQHHVVGGAMHHHYPHSGDGRIPHPESYPNYIPQHYRTGPIYGHPRLHEFHPYQIPGSHHHHHRD